MAHKDKANRPDWMSGWTERDGAINALFKRLEKLLDKAWESDKLEPNRNTLSIWVDPTTFDHIRGDYKQRARHDMSGDKTDPLFQEKGWSHFEIYGYPVFVSYIPRWSVSESYVAVDDVSPNDTVDTRTDFLLAVRLKQRNGRIVYLDDPDTSEIYK